MSEDASGKERRERLDRRIDEASMLSFPASDPPAIFVEDLEPARPKASRGTCPSRRGIEPDRLGDPPPDAIESTESVRMSRWSGHA